MIAMLLTAKNMINVLKLGVCLTTSFAPYVAIISLGDVLTAYQEFGLAGIFVGLGLFWFYLWRKTYTRLDEEKEKRIADRDRWIEEVKRDRDEYRSEVDRLYRGDSK